MTVIEQVAKAVAEAVNRETGGNLRAYAKLVDLPYDATYALVRGRRARSVNAEMLVKLSAHIPEVRALFAPDASQIRND